MNKSLVAFFSATGTTKKTAELIASATNADFYEILPKIPYSASDLDWMDNHSRSSMEMKENHTVRHIRRQRIWKYQKRASVFRTGRHFNRRKIMQSYVQKRN